MLPLACQPASARSLPVRRPLTPKGGSVSDARMGGSAEPLMITESCTGIAGVGRCSRTKPETGQLRCACTKAFSDAATSAAVVPK